MNSATFRRCILAAVVAALFLPSCGRPSGDDRENRRVVDELLTAITLKNRNLLDAAAKRVATRRDTGQLTEDEDASLEAIVATARAGNWGSAETDGYAFRKEHPFVREGQ